MSDRSPVAGQTSGVARATQPGQSMKLPAPRPDASAYRLNRWVALATSPRRLANYVRYLRSRRSARLNYLPIKLDFENVSRCNFHCTMCQVSDWPKHQRARDMTLEDFKRIIDSQYGLVEIKLQGLGEPLLGRGSYFDMIRYARSKHIWVRTATNASLLYLDDGYRKLIDSGVNEVQISVDGACKETYEKIRRGAQFERMVENCKLINGYCEARGLLRTRMWVVLQRDNVQEFFSFVELSHELGFKRLSFALNLNDWGQESWSATNRAVSVEDSITPELAEEAVQRGRRLGLDVGFWKNASKYSPVTLETLCPWPFERAYVSSDLRIVPCCMIGNPEVADLGDAGDFTAQWQSGVYQAFRQAHLDGRIPKVCQGCY